jgi:hypothetical protein
VDEVNTLSLKQNNSEVTAEVAYSVRGARVVLESLYKLCKCTVVCHHGNPSPVAALLNYWHT